MSGWHELRRIGCLVEPRCPDYIDNLFGAFLVTADLFPVTMTLVFFGASLIRSEFVLFYTSLGLTADYWINYALRQIFRQMPPVPGCGEQFEMPALSTQHAVFVTMLMLLVVVRWRIYVSEWKCFVLFAFVGTVTYARVYIGFNTAAQLLAGAGVGLLHGLAWFALYNWWVHPHVDSIIGWPVVRWFDFRNTLCVPRHYLEVPPL